MGRMIALAVLLAGAGSGQAQAVLSLGRTPAQACYLAANVADERPRMLIRLCDRAVDRVRTRAELAASFVNRGILKWRAGRTAPAIEDFDRAIETDPTLSAAWLNRGLIAVSGDEAAARAAVPYFDAALERGTQRPALAYYGRAQAQEVRGNVTAAYRDYRKAAELEPGWPLPLRELARFKVLTPRPGQKHAVQRG